MIVRQVVHNLSFSSLCNLRVLCAFVVVFLYNHRGTENTEVAQRNLKLRHYQLVVANLSARLINFRGG